MSSEHKLWFCVHDRIDMQKWDACIAEAINGLPYALSWYLDVVCEKRWDAIIAGDYSAVFPIPRRGFFFMKKAYQPFFTQQLGLFFRHASDANLLPDCVSLLTAKYRFFRVHLNAMNHATGPEYQVQKRLTHVIDLTKNITDLRAAYTHQIQRNLRKALQFDLQVVESNDAQLLIAMRKKHLAHVIRQGRQKESDTQRLCTLMETAMQKRAGTIRFVKDADGAVLAGVFLLQSNKRIIYLSSVSSDTGREKHAMTFLIDSLLEEFAGTQNIFDFEGSMLPGLARYYKGFGGLEEPFTVIYAP